MSYFPHEHSVKETNRLQALFCHYGMKLPPIPYITALWPDYISGFGDENPYLNSHQGYSLEVPSLGL